MNKEAWLRFIPDCKNANQIREVFNDTYALVHGDEEVYKIFIDTIDKLLENEINLTCRDALDHLKDDIEIEYETGARKKKAEGSNKPNLHLVREETPRSETSRLQAAMRKIGSMKDELNQIERLLAAVLTRKKDG